MSRYSIPLTGTNLEFNHPKQGEPLAKFHEERPSNAPKNLANRESNVVTILTTIPLQSKEDLEKILTKGDSDDLEFHDSYDANMDSQDDSK